VEDNGAEDYTFDDDGVENQPEEETLFGVPPAQRIHAQGRSREQAGVGHLLGDDLRMLGEELLEDTIGIGAQVARRGGIEETPTPAPQWNGSR
jgi:DASH complex subunit ASK1